MNLLDALDRLREIAERPGLTEPAVTDRHAAEIVLDHLMALAGGDISLGTEYGVTFPCGDVVPVSREDADQVLSATQTVGGAYRQVFTGPWRPYRREALRTG